MTAALDSWQIWWIQVSNIVVLSPQYSIQRNDRLYTSNSPSQRRPASQGSRRSSNNKSSTEQNRQPSSSLHSPSIRRIFTSPSIHPILNLSSTYPVRYPQPFSEIVRNRLYSAHDTGLQEQCSSHASTRSATSRENVLCSRCNILAGRHAGVRGDDLRTRWHGLDVGENGNNQLGRRWGEFVAGRRRLWDGDRVVGSSGDMAFGPQEDRCLKTFSLKRENCLTGERWSTSTKSLSTLSTKMNETTKTNQKWEDMDDVGSMATLIKKQEKKAGRKHMAGTIFQSSTTTISHRRRLRWKTSNTNPRQGLKQMSPLRVPYVEHHYTVWHTQPTPESNNKEYCTLIQATTLTPTHGTLHVLFPITPLNQPRPMPIERPSTGCFALNICPLLKSRKHRSDQ